MPKCSSPFWYFNLSEEYRVAIENYLSPISILHRWSTKQRHMTPSTYWVMPAREGKFFHPGCFWKVHSELDTDLLKCLSRNSNNSSLIRSTQTNVFYSGSCLFLEGDIKEVSSDDNNTFITKSGKIYEKAFLAFRADRLDCLKERKSGVPKPWKAW